MRKQITLTIIRSELLKIVAGSKVEEYRDVKEYYKNMFRDQDPETCEINDPCETIVLRNGYFGLGETEEVTKDGFTYAHPKNKVKGLYAIIKVKKIVCERFMKKIPEGFRQGDIAYTIYIDKVLEHNCK